MTPAAVPAPRFRDQLAEDVLRALVETLPHSVGCAAHGGECVCFERRLARATLQAAEVLPIVEARVQAAANQRAAERRWASDTAWEEGYEACRRGDQRYRNPYRAALSQPAPGGER